LALIYRKAQSHGKKPCGHWHWEMPVAVIFPPGIAVDVDMKLAPYWFIGARNTGAVYYFIHDLKS
jgi:hypothetical protein